MRDPTTLLLRFGRILLAAGSLALADSVDHQFSPVGPEFLLSLQVDEAHTAECRSLLDQLGSDHFATRQKAERALFNTAVIPMEELARAEHSDNVERQVTVRRLREHMLLQLEDPLSRAFGEIRKERMPGWVDEVLYAMRFCDNKETYYNAELCLATTTEAKDLPALRQALSSTWRYERQLAAVTLLNDKSAEALDRCVPLLTDPDAELSLYLIHLYLEAGDHRGLLPLIDLLEKENPEHRIIASAILKRIARVEVDDQRSPDEWRAWAKTDGPAALTASLASSGRLVIEAGLKMDFEFGAVPVNAIDNTPAKVRNVRSSHGVMHLNGDFGALDAIDTSYHFSATAAGPWKAENGLTLIVEFKPAATAQAYTLLRFGSRAYINLKIDPTGTLGYSFTSPNASVSISLGQRINPTGWNKLTLTFGDDGGSFNSKLNQQPLRNMGFQRFNITFADFIEGNPIVLTLDPQNRTTAFHGEVATLKIYNRSLSSEEVDESHETGRFVNEP